MVSLHYLITVILETYFNRCFIRLPAGPLQEHHFEAVPEKGTVILPAVSFLLTFSFFLLQGSEIYQITSQRFWRKRTASQVLAPLKAASWGPKSPTRAGIHLYLLGGLLGIHLGDYMTKLNANAMPWSPEGSGPATRSGEAYTVFANQDTFTAKPSGLGSTHQRLDGYQHFPKKKSFIRAIKRAQLHGHTWYKGKLYTAQMLGVTPLPWQLPEPPKASLGPKNTTPPAKLLKNPLQGLSWNIGSLSTYKFDILRQWMHHQQLDILQLQDTRWGFTGDWSDNSFAYIHSGSSDRAGGLLTIVRKAFCQPDRISWREATPGHSRTASSCTALP